MKALPNEKPIIKDPLCKHAMLKELSIDNPIFKDPSSMLHGKILHQERSLYAHHKNMTLLWNQQSTSSIWFKISLILIWRLWSASSNNQLAACHGRIRHRTLTTWLPNHKFYFNLHLQILKIQQKSISTDVIKQILPMGDIFSEVVLLLQVIVKELLV